MRTNARLLFLRAERRRLVKIEKFNGYKDERITKEINLLDSQLARQKELLASIKAGTFSI